MREGAGGGEAWVETFGTEAEDVHSFGEKALVEERGPLGWKRHTGRSRNELVATDFRLFVIDAAAQIQYGLVGLMESLLRQAKAHLNVPMAGLDPIQRPQPIFLSPFPPFPPEVLSPAFNPLQTPTARAHPFPLSSRS